MEHLILKRIFVLFNNNRNGREIMGMGENSLEKRVIFNFSSFFK